MQLHLDGANTMNASREKVFSLLTDTNFLAKTLPDAEEVHILDGSSLEAKMKLKIAVVSSTMKMKMSITDVDPPSRATLRADGAGSGSNIKLVSLFTLDGGSPTKMNWSADAEITGVMAGLGSGLLKGFATKKVAEIMQGITQAVEAASA